MSDGPITLLRMTALQMMIDYYKDNPVSVEVLLAEAQKTYEFLSQDLPEEKKKDATVSPLRPV